MNLIWSFHLKKPAGCCRFWSLWTLDFGYDWDFLVAMSGKCKEVSIAMCRLRSVVSRYGRGPPRLKHFIQARRLVEKRQQRKPRKEKIKLVKKILIFQISLECVLFGKKWLTFTFYSQSHVAGNNFDQKVLKGERCVIKQAWNIFWPLAWKRNWSSSWKEFSQLKEVSSCSRSHITQPNIIRNSKKWWVNFF